MKLSDIYNSICIDSSVENKNCILLKLYFTYSTQQCKCTEVDPTKNMVDRLAEPPCNLTFHHGFPIILVSQPIIQGGPKVSTHTLVFIAQSLSAQMK